MNRYYDMISVVLSLEIKYRNIVHMNSSRWLYTGIGSPIVDGPEVPELQSHHRVTARTVERRVGGATAGSRPSEMQATVGVSYIPSEMRARGSELYTRIWSVRACE